MADRPVDRNVQVRKKSEKSLKDGREFVNSLIQNAYDIRTKDKGYQKKLEDEFGVKMTKYDEIFMRIIVKGLIRLHVHQLFLKIG